MLFDPTLNLHTFSHMIKKSSSFSLVVISLYFISHERTDCVLMHDTCWLVRKERVSLALRQTDIPLYSLARGLKFNSTYMTNLIHNMNDILCDNLNPNPKREVIFKHPQAKRQIIITVDSRHCLNSHNSRIQIFPTAIFKSWVNPKRLGQIRQTISMYAHVNGIYGIQWWRGWIWSMQMKFLWFLVTPTLTWPRLVKLKTTILRHRKKRPNVYKQDTNPNKFGVDSRLLKPDNSAKNMTFYCFFVSW